MGWYDMLGEGLESDLSYDSGGSDWKKIFWVKKGETREVVILASANNKSDWVTVYEHNIKLNGKWGNRFTCLEHLEKPCPLCEYAAKHKSGGRTKVMYFNVIDLTKTVGKDGTVYENQVKIVPAKKDTIDILRRRIEACQRRGQDIKGMKFAIYRASTTKSAAVGNDWEMLEHVDMAQYAMCEPIDMLEFLKPDEVKVKEAMRQLAADRTGVEGPHSGASSDVPF